MFANPLRSNCRCVIRIAGLIARLVAIASDKPAAVVKALINEF